MSVAQKLINKMTFNFTENPDNRVTNTFGNILPFHGHDEKKKFMLQPSREIKINRNMSGPKPVYPEYEGDNNTIMKIVMKDRRIVPTPFFNYIKPEQFKVPYNQKIIRAVIRNHLNGLLKAEVPIDQWVEIENHLRGSGNHINMRLRLVDGSWTQEFDYVKLLEDIETNAEKGKRFVLVPAKEMQKIQKHYRIPFSTNVELQPYVDLSLLTNEEVKKSVTSRSKTTKGGSGYSDKSKKSGKKSGRFKGNKVKQLRKLKYESLNS